MNGGAHTGDFNTGVRAQSLAGTLVQSFAIGVSADALPVKTITPR